MAQIGYGQTQRDVMNKVQELVTKLNIPNPFPEGKPTKKWYRLFMKWHPILKERIAQDLSRERAEVSFDNIICWFQDLQEYMQRNGVEYILDDPSDITIVMKLGSRWHQSNITITTRLIWKLCIRLDELRPVCVMAGKWFHEGHQGEGCDTTSITTYWWGKEPLVFPCIWVLQQEWHHSVCPASQCYPSNTTNGSCTDEFYQESI